MSNIVEGPHAKRAKWADLFKRTDIWGHHKPVPLADEALRDLATKIQEQDAIDVPPPLPAAGWIAIVATPNGHSRGSGPYLSKLHHSIAR